MQAAFRIWEKRIEKERREEERGGEERRVKKRKRERKKEREGEFFPGASRRNASLNFWVSSS